MKKFLSIFLTVCMICSLVVLPTISVSATETVLYSPDTQVGVVDFSSFADVTADEISNVNITTGLGGINANLTKTAGSVAMVKEDDTTLKVTTDMVTTVGGANINIVPETKSDRATGTVTTFKIKIDSLTKKSDGTDTTTCGRGSTFVHFQSLGTNASGVTQAQRAVQYMYDGYTSAANQASNTGYTAAQFSRGAGAGASSYMEAKQAVKDADGYYNFKIVTSSSATQDKTEIYDLNNGGLLICYHYFNNGNTRYTGKQIDGIRLGLDFSSLDHDVRQTVHIKDIKSTQNIDNEGSLSSSTAKYSTAYDTESNTHTFWNIPGLSIASPLANVNFNKTLETGTVRVDMKLKEEGCVAMNGYTGSLGWYKRFGINGTTTSDSYCKFDSDTKNISGTAMYTNPLYIAGSSNISTVSSADTVNNDGWSDLRMIISRPTTDVNWTVAIYNKNVSLSDPIALYNYANIGNLTGLNFSTYIEQSSRSQSDASETAPYCKVLTTIKDLTVHEVDTVDDAATQTFYATNGESTTWSNTDSSITWTGKLYATNQNAMAVIAAYDADGVEVGKAETPITAGTLSDVSLTINDITYDDSLDKRVYVYNGSTWYGGIAYVEPVPTVEVDIATTAAFGYANVDDTDQVLRFYFVPTYAEDVTVTDFGAYIVPFVVFNSETPSTNSEMVNGAKSIASGDEYSADLAGIPTGAYNTSIVALPFVVVNDNYVFGDVATFTVNNLIAE